jgi:hypothetical protein
MGTDLAFKLAELRGQIAELGSSTAITEGRTE